MAGCLVCCTHRWNAEFEVKGRHGVCDVLQRHMDPVSRHPPTLSQIVPNPANSVTTEAGLTIPCQYYLQSLLFTFPLFNTSVNQPCFPSSFLCLSFLVTVALFFESSSTVLPGTSGVWVVGSTVETRNGFIGICSLCIASEY